MSIVRYDPFRELRALQDEVGRLFTTNVARNGEDENIARGVWSPNVDIMETKDQIVLEAELPGLNRDEFDLLIENNVITLKGERRFEKKQNADNYHRVERSYGAFTRSFTLPQTVKTEGTTAKYENGVLRVAIPKREEVKARKIEVAGLDASPVIEVEKAKSANS